MMRRILLLTCMIFSFVVHTEELNLYQRFSPRRQTIDGISFPRNNQLLYRGVNVNQMDAQRAIRAMLGDRNSNLESPLLYAVKELLMGKTVDLFTSLPALTREYTNLTLNYSMPFEEVKKKPLKEEEAFQKAVEIITEVLDNKFTHDQYANQYLNYLNAYREDWPTSLIYSTVHVEVAKIYSTNIVVFEDGQSSRNYRSLDLNFWNKVQNGVWIGTDNEFPDKGEFLTPLYIPYNNIVGYQYQRGTATAVWHIWQDLQNDLGVAFYKTTLNGNDFVLVVDGHVGDSTPLSADIRAFIAENPSYASHFSDTLTQTVVREGGDYFYANSTFDPAVTHPTYPVKLSRDRVKIYGVIESCPTDCSQDVEALFAKYKLSKRNNSRIFNLVKNMKVNGQKVNLHNSFSMKQKKLKGEKDKLEVMGPEELVDYLKGEEKGSAQVVSTCITSKREIQCDLNDLKVGPGETLFIPVSETLRKRSVEKAFIEQRQDPAEQDEDELTGWDKEPGYSSIQFLQLSQEDNDYWRFFGGRLPHRPDKGALFAEIRPLTDNKAQVLDFSENPHKGYVLEDRDKNPIHAYAIKIVNTGKDNTYINTFKVSFK